MDDLTIRKISFKDFGYSSSDLVDFNKTELYSRRFGTSILTVKIVTGEFVYKHKPYDVNTNYNTNDRVTYVGCIYSSKTFCNKNNNPQIHNAHWDCLGPASNDRYHHTYIYDSGHLIYESRNIDNENYRMIQTRDINMFINKYFSSSIFIN